LTQQELGESLGLHSQQIHRYECASNRVSAARLHRIATALKAPTQYFFDGVSNGNGAANDRYDILSNEETLALVHACLKLPEQVRRKLFEFAAALGTECV
jgi:transcriptional regulator with XRE-family HTH domain